MKTAIRAIIKATLPVVMFFAVSCSTPREALQHETSAVREGKQLYNSMISNIPGYNKVSMKCFLTLGKISSRAQVRMINGEYMQISFQPFLGIEMFRLVFTTDSIYIMDRINSVAAVEPISTFAGKLPGGAGISQIQSLVLGTPFLISGNISRNDYDKFIWKNRDGKNILQALGTGSVQIEFTVSSSGEVEQVSVIDEKGNTLNGIYSARKNTKSGVTVPGAARLHLSVPTRGISEGIEINEISYDWDKTFEPDTVISRKYTRITFDEFVKTYIK